MDDVRRKKTGDVLLGEDWISPDAVADPALRSARGRKGIFALNRWKTNWFNWKRTTRSKPD